MKLGFVKPNYPNEKRVALLPKHINNFENELLIEEGFGSFLDIEDHEYEFKGCKMRKREDIFKECEAIFSLKLLQPEDYDLLRCNQIIIGWTHPTGSGTEFFKTQAVPKKLFIVDLDNIYPSVYFENKKKPINWIPRNFVADNSFYAGYACTMHALMVYGIIPNINTKVAVLSAGNVAQGAFNAVSKLGANVRLFYRKTMSEFKDNIGEFDIIINGIEVDTPDSHIINKNELLKVKNNCLIIDAAADAGNAIEGTHYTSIDDPIYRENNIYFYVVNNAPSIFYRVTSEAISKSFSEFVYKKDVSCFYDLIK